MFLMQGEEVQPLYTGQVGGDLQPSQIGDYLFDLSYWQMFVLPARTASVPGGHCCLFSACSSSWETTLPLLASTRTPAPWNVQGER